MARMIRVQEALSASGHRQYSAQQVANAFVSAYYRILRISPERIHQFYKDESTLSRPGADGSMRSVTTKRGINDEIMGSDITYGDFNLLNVQALATVADSVIIGVAGLFSKDNVLKCFSQTFLLAPQTRGLYVHSDFFQFIDTSYLSIPNAIENYQVPMNDKAISTEVDNDIANQIFADTDDSIIPDDEQNQISAPSSTHEAGEKVAKGSCSLPLKNAIVEVSTKTNMQPCAPSDALHVKTIAAPDNGATKEAAREVVERDQKDNEKDKKDKSTCGQDVVHTENDQVEKNSPPNAQEVAKKESYASIVTKAISLPIPPPASQQLLAVKSSSIVPATTQSSSIPSKPSTAPQIVKTIYVKNIPPQVTLRSLTQAFKGFGSVKYWNIQMRGFEEGCRYASVEFNHPKAARLAIQAGFIKFDDWECQIESEKAHIEGPEGCDDTGNDDNVNDGNDSCNGNGGASGSGTGGDNVNA